MQEWDPDVLDREGDPGDYIDVPGTQNWQRHWIDHPVASGVFLTPTPMDVARYHGRSGNVYAYRVPEWVIAKAGGVHRYDHGSEILISEELWEEAGNEIEFLGKSMTRDELWDRIRVKGREVFGRSSGSKPGWMTDKEWEDYRAQSSSAKHVSGLRATKHPENAVRMMTPEERTEVLSAFESQSDPRLKDEDLINLLRQSLSTSPRSASG